MRAIAIAAALFLMVAAVIYVPVKATMVLDDALASALPSGQDQGQPTPILLGDGGIVSYACANGLLSGSWETNHVTIACATDTPTLTPVPTATATSSPTATATDTATATPTNTTTPTDTTTPTVVPSDTPTATSTDSPTATSTDSPTMTSTPTATVTATATSTSTDTPTATSVPFTATATATATSSHWGGPLGWILLNTSDIATWNANARPTDIAFAPFTSNLAATMATIHAGRVGVGFQITGTASAPVNQVTAANLAAADAALQTKDGAIVETLAYADDNYSDTVPNKIALMQTNVDTIHLFVRANGAPPFLVMYTPAGGYITTQLPTNPLIATYPDTVMFQTQSFEDSAVGAAPSFLSNVQLGVNNLHAAAPSHTFGIQVMDFSKSTPATVWTVAKVQQDIDAATAIANPSWVSIFHADGSNATLATSTFNSILALYRP